MTHRLISRRDLLKKVWMVGVAASVAPAVFNAGCGGSEPLQCTDTRGLSQADVAMRNSNAYVDHSPDAAKNCDNCNFFESRGAAACGTCKVIKGPIAPLGTCRLWAAKIAT